MTKMGRKADWPLWGIRLCGFGAFRIPVAYLADGMASHLLGLFNGIRALGDLAQAWVASP